MKLKPEDHGWTKQGPSWYTKLFKPNMLCGIVKDTGWYGTAITWILFVRDKEYPFKTLSEAVDFTNDSYMFKRWNLND